MKPWLGSALLLVVGSFFVAAGCGTSGSPPGSRAEGPAGASSGGASGSTGNSAGTGATSGGFVLGDGGGSSDGCPSTCEALNANCGFVTDVKCTGVVECGSCQEGQFCGGDGPSRCGTKASGDGGACSGTDCQACVPKSCAEQGFNCGPAGDTCGNKLDCGPTTCGIPGQTCGGGANPGVCGCTGACAQIPDCSAAAVKTTSISGKVFDPAGANPLYNVFVYVANDPTDPELTTFAPGVTCDVCGATAAGSPLPSDAKGTFGTFTDTSGNFKLNNVPVGKGISVVIQLGRWRRVFKLDIDTPCADNAVAQLKMPAKKSEGNIPLIAMVTGKSDSIECVLKKMGIDATEFTNPSGGGRVQFYLGSNAAGALQRNGQFIDVNTPMQSALFAPKASNQPTINDYDMTLLACQGSRPTQSAADMAALRSYAASGGRVFVTHYNAPWLETNQANPAAAAGTADNWNEVAKWHWVEGDRNGTGTGIIDLVSNPKGNVFKSWLEAVNASAVGSGSIPLIAVNHSTDSVSVVPGQTQQWLYRNGKNLAKCSVGGDTCTPGVACNTTGTCVGDDYSTAKVPAHFTFNTPVNLVEDLSKSPPAVQCGRVLFSDFHVADVNNAYDDQFPSLCNNLPMNAQEKLLEYMIFDLGSCVPPIKACVPKTQCPAGNDCGYAPDGCGGLISCGVCPTGLTCGVGTPPVPNKCGKGQNTCTPKTCAAQNIECGPAADGCGAKIDSCGQCLAGELCVQGKCAHIN